MQKIPLAVRKALLGLCMEKGCRRKREKENPRCSRHAKRIFRAKHPEAARFGRIKQRANEKHLPFTLSLQEFKQFCKSNNWNGIDHIDRISAGKGYSLDNIQILPPSENIAKGNRERHGQYQLY